MDLGGQFLRQEIVFSENIGPGRRVSREIGKWEVFRCLKWVVVARYGLSMGGNESYGFWEAFGTPPGSQNGEQNSKNLENPGNSGKSGCLGSHAGVIANVAWDLQALPGLGPWPQE